MGDVSLLSSTEATLSLSKQRSGCDSLVSVSNLEIEDIFALADTRHGLRHGAGIILSAAASKGGSSGGGTVDGLLAG